MKGYVGSSIDLFSRITAHFNDLKQNKHRNKHLQNSWNKYEKDNFEIYIIEYCNKDTLFEREQFYANLYKTHYSKCGYNLACVEKGNAGYSFTEEQKKKVYDGVKKVLENKEYKNKRQAKITEYARSEEGRKQRSATSKKNWNNPEIRKNIIKGLSNPTIDDKRLKENLDPIILANRKEKVSKASKQYFSDPVNRQKMSEEKIEYFSDPANRQKISETTSKAMNTPEMKQKISLAMKKFNVENPEHVKEVTKKCCKIFDTKEYRNKLSCIGKELWATDRHRNKMINEKKERFSKQENKDKMKEISNSMWNDPIKYKATLEKRSNITKEQFEQLKELYRLGYKQYQIAKVLGCKKEAIGRILRGEFKLFVLI